MFGEKGYVGIILVAFIIAATAILVVGYTVFHNQQIELVHNEFMIIKSKVDLDNARYFLNDSARFAAEWAALYLGGNGFGYGMWSPGNVPSEDYVKTKLRDEIDTKMGIYQALLEGESNIRIQFFSTSYYDIQDDYYEVKTNPKVKVKLNRPDFELSSEYEFHKKIDMKYLLAYKKVKKFVQTLSLPDSDTCSMIFCKDCNWIESVCLHSYMSKINSHLASHGFTEDGVTVSAAVIPGTLNYDYSQDCINTGNTCCTGCWKTCTDPYGIPYPCWDPCCVTDPEKRADGLIEGKDVKILIKARDTVNQILTKSGYTNPEFSVVYHYYF
ncbi:MAG: hypothetical protein DRP11_00645 [Candidatus Aenigmatarchaeota archaeon]|nr:MAG: hypothetical protein DRP11_00645 [Candidatus Aenigmarchaeota archaeon]